MQNHFELNTLFLLFIITLNFSCLAKNKKTQSNESSMGELVTTLDNQIWDIYQDQKGNYWFGSNGKGIYHYDGKELRLYTHKDGLVNNTIRGIQEDDLGNIFIETQRGGISKYDGHTFTTLEPVISPLNAWKLEANDLWFNCDGIIYRYDGNLLFQLKLPTKDLNKAFGTEVEGLSFKGMNHSPYAVYGIDKDKAGNLWIGTVVAGAFRYDGNSFLWIAEKELSTLPDGRVPAVRSMIEDKNGYIWLSNFISKYKINDSNLGAGYEKLKGIDKLNKHFPNRIPYFNSGLSDRRGNLWMTTYTGGAWKYDGDKLYNFPIPDDGTEVLLISIYEDNKGVLWLGTDNAGVFKFNGNSFEKFEIY